MIINGALKRIGREVRRVKKDEKLICPIKFSSCPALIILIRPLIRPLVKLLLSKSLNLTDDANKAIQSNMAMVVGAKCCPNLKLLQVSYKSDIRVSMCVSTYTTFLVEKGK